MNLDSFVSKTVIFLVNYINSCSTIDKFYFDHLILFFFIINLLIVLAFKIGIILILILNI